MLSFTQRKKTNKSQDTGFYLDCQRSKSWSGYSKVRADIVHSIKLVKIHLEGNSASALYMHTLIEQQCIPWLYTDTKK